VLTSVTSGYGKLISTILAVGETPVTVKIKTSSQCKFDIYTNKGILDRLVLSNNVSYSTLTRDDGVNQILK
jgi:hypothetical protein